MEEYRHSLCAQPILLTQVRLELKRKTLGCWCKPNACHGDVMYWQKLLMKRLKNYLVIRLEKFFSSDPK
ncbi:MAG: DUF4326 domain-containing protein [Thermoproteota archaeon]|nr:DUF4326 domain-containing protein [Thermoproteota archaeon]